MRDAAEEGGRGSLPLPRFLLRSFARLTDDVQDENVGDPLGCYCRYIDGGDSENGIEIYERVEKSKRGSASFPSLPSRSKAVQPRLLPSPFSSIKSSNLDLHVPRSYPTLGDEHVVVPSFTRQKPKVPNVSSPEMAVEERVALKK